MKLFLRVCPDMRPCLTSSGDQFLIGRNIALSFPLPCRKQHPIAVRVRFLHWVPSVPWSLPRLGDKFRLTLCCDACQWYAEALSWHPAARRCPVFESWTQKDFFSLFSFCRLPRYMRGVPAGFPLELAGRPSTTVIGQA